MITVKVFEDRIVNFKEVITGLLNNEKNFLIDEGPDLSKVMIEDMPFLDLLVNKGIEVQTYNLVQEQVSGLKIEILNQCLPFLYYANKKLTSDKKNIEKHFGMFVGGSRWHRLFLASNLYARHKDQSLISYRQSAKINYQPCNLHIDELYLHTAKINNNNFFTEINNFISHLPLQLTKEPNDNCGYINFDQAWEISELYEKLFVDIVQETWHNGKTFYPTEKIARPIACYTPFIVYGGVDFLNNLKKIGFKTFNDFWSESYDKLSGCERIIAINRLVKNISFKSVDELKNMYNDMQPILKHNAELYQNLDKGMKVF
jgi:hypothetical protein|tara:strand:+ start:55 stop:1002 length:948 start_codon:yes stop_codon:yes gene_type:complete